MITPKAAGIAATSSVSATDKAPSSAGSGWDPIEVWRTRVLLPRLEQRALANRKTDTGTSAKVVALRSGS